MTYAIVHTGTGQTFPAYECRIVALSADTLANLTGDDYFDDVDIARFAVEYGHDAQTVVNYWQNWRAIYKFEGWDIPCAACELVGEDTWINPFTATVVAWDVMGDDRAFAFVCDTCAAVSNGD